MQGKVGTPIHHAFTEASCTVNAKEQLRRQPQLTLYFGTDTLSSQHTCTAGPIS
jgi:hypothetical protein